MMRMGESYAGCPHCGYEWQPRAMTPASCPRCKQYLRPPQVPRLHPWNRPEARLVSRVRDLERDSHVNTVTAVLVMNHLVERGLLTEEEAEAIYSEAIEDAEDEMLRSESERT